ncbi:MAG: hypothetical protein ABI543_14960 [Ignavibacteria bacterium]
MKFQPNSSDELIHPMAPNHRKNESPECLTTEGMFDQSPENKSTAGMRLIPAQNKLKTHSSDCSMKIDYIERKAIPDELFKAGTNSSDEPESSDDCRTGNFNELLCLETHINNE